MATSSKTATQRVVRAVTSSIHPPRSCLPVSRSITTAASHTSRPSRPVSLSSQCLRLQPRRTFTRTFTSTPASRFPSDPAKQTRSGPFSLRAAALFIGTGLALIGYFQYEKARLERKRVVEMSKGYGKPKVGGPFTLQDLEGKDVTEKDLLGKYSIIYFGFTHCPDICPDELDKLSAAIDILNTNPTSAHTFRSIFISVDPARDTPAVLKDYLAEFHPHILGLTGTWQQIKDTCKAYRVYFSTPQDLKPGEEDYLVDHSIYFYVMDPEGDFVECIGRQDTPESAAAIILEHIKDWRKEGKTVDQTPLQYKNEAVQRTSQGRSSEIGGGGIGKVNSPA